MNIPLNIDWQQILLHLLNFAILAGGLYLLLYKPVKKFMEQRIAYYQKMDTDAAAYLKEADNFKVAYEMQLKEAEQEINTLRVNTLKKAEEQAASQIHTAKEQSKKILSDAQEKAQAEKQKILDESRQEIAQLAASAAQKILLSSDNMYGQFITSAKGGEPHDGCQ